MIFSALVFFISVFVTLTPFAVQTAVSDRKLPIYCVDRQDNKISLTFDCAWNADDVDEIISVLDEYDCKSTFFVVGDWALKYPNAVKKLSNAGHEISNHSYNHKHYAKLNKDELKEDMDKCDEVIEKIVGFKNNLVRSPYGEYNNTVVEASHESGREIIQWSVDSLDWKDLSVAEITDRVVKKTESGSIILLHNGTKNTAKALKTILPELKSKGFSFVPVSEIIYKENFYIDNTGKQCLLNKDVNN